MNIKTMRRSAHLLLTTILFAVVFASAHAQSDGTTCTSDCFNDAWGSVGSDAGSIYCDGPGGPDFCHFSFRTRVRVACGMFRDIQVTEIILEPNCVCPREKVLAYIMDAAIKAAATRTQGNWTALAPGSFSDMYRVTAGSCISSHFGSDGGWVTDGPCDVKTCCMTMYHVERGPDSSVHYIPMTNAQTANCTSPDCTPWCGSSWVTQTPGGPVMPYLNGTNTSKKLVNSGGRERSLALTLHRGSNTSFILRGELNASTPVHVNIFDVKGNTVVSRDLETRADGKIDAEIAADGLPSGAYFYQIFEGNTLLGNGALPVVK